MTRRCLLPLLLVAAFAAAHAATDDDYAAERRQLINLLKLTATTLRHGTGFFTVGKPLDERVLAVMARVPRHAFVPPEERSRAYKNVPLPIGYSQTISQPYIVAVMTDLLELDGDEVVLEVGTGSGYQAAVLAELVREVYTIEIIEPLAHQATERLARLGYDNVTTRLGDGYYGWDEKAPFDAVIVTAAASHVPPPLIRQLKPQGRMAIPVGGRFLTQHLMLVEKDDEGRIKTWQLLPVRFVPLLGGH
ncbi:MAG: protein-L-isoaspartate(D-aspartate) O-methyltransferase [Alphaproteobacteria bacterium]